MKTYRTEKTMAAAMKRMKRKFATSCEPQDYKPQHYSQFLAARTLDTSTIFFFHAA